MDLCALSHSPREETNIEEMINTVKNTTNNNNMTSNNTVKILVKPIPTKALSWVFKQVYSLPTRMVSKTAVANFPRNPSSSTRSWQ